MPTSRPATAPAGMPSPAPAAGPTACPRTCNDTTGTRGTRRLTFPLVSTVVTLPVVCLLAIASVIAAPGNVLPMSGRALSLRVLQERVQDCQPQGNCDEVVLHLAGLKRIHGYVVDEGNHDVVLIGQVEPSSWPALHLQDLVIALRDAWQLYVVTRGQVQSIADPGVSIDPHPEVIAHLQRIGEFLSQASGPAGQEGVAAWHETCHLPQNTRVEGIPFDTRFSSVMMLADYALKRWVDGSEPLALEGFRSLSALHMAAAKQALHAGKAATLRLSTMSRFWFSPTKLMLKEQPGMAIIDPSLSVQLLTEEEHVSQQGQMVGKGAAAPLAAQWARMVSQLYPHIAAQQPVFRELENLAWFVALARTIKFRNATGAAGLSLEWLLRHFAVPETPVPRTLPGHSNIDTYEYRQAVAGGYVVGALLMPSCGGVHLAVELNNASFSRDGSGRLSRVKQALRTTRPGSAVLSWDF